MRPQTQLEPLWGPKSHDTDVRGDSKNNPRIDLGWEPKTTSWPDQTISPGKTQLPKRPLVEPPPMSSLKRYVTQDTTVIQVWEGKVLDVDHRNARMQVLLDAKLGNIPQHTGEIELQWVAEQDKDLVSPGAVFYLTLYKRTKRGSIENSQELRFRRLPSWTKCQLDQVTREASMILAKLKSRPLAE